jgi:hypothetical protein
MGLSAILAFLMWSETCFLPPSVVSDSRREWYCRQGDAAGLGPLEGERVYRFIWIPSFHPTRAVTVRLEASSVIAEGVVLSGRGGYQPGQVARTTRRTISAEDWRLLEQRLENAGVWEAPDRDPRNGEDGSQWLLEGRRQGKTFFRDVWSPTETTFPQYRKAALFMLRLADIEPDGETY